MAPKAGLAPPRCESFRSAELAPCLRLAARRSRHDANSSLLIYPGGLATNFRQATGRPAEKPARPVADAPARSGQTMAKGGERDAKWLADSAVLYLSQKKLTRQAPEAL